MLLTAANRGSGHAISPGRPGWHPARSLCPERLALSGPMRCPSPPRPATATHTGQKTRRRQPLGE